MTKLEQDLAARLRHMIKTARMWGSPEELETVAQHFTHVWLAARSPGWTFDETHALWRDAGAPFAQDADEHALMRAKMWQADEQVARAQVIQGFAVVWASLERDPEREEKVGPWLEALLDAPERAGTPDRLNMVLFALMGFVAKEPQRYVEALGAERTRIGGHHLRAFHIVGAAGPSEASLTYGRKFTSWDRVAQGIAAILARLEAPVV